MELLPRELVSNVFSRLPAKQLIPCKCVCKSWLDIITDPHFISNYYVSYNNQKEKLLVIRTTDVSFNSEISIVSWNPNEPKGLVSSQVLNHPHYKYKSWWSIMGPCNGIYFLQGSPHVIMNPSLGQFIALPAPHRTQFLGEYPCFGFDPKTNDYKVLVLREMSGTNELLMGNWRVDLYSLNSNSWRNLGAHAIPFPFATTNVSGLCPYVNNCCHRWGFVYRNKDVDVVENLVLSFDMVTELFRKIKVPQVTHSSGGGSINLVAFTESSTIGFIAYPVSQVAESETRSCFDVWMMKDYWDDGSWIKQYSIGPLPVIYKQLVGFCEGNRFLWKDANNRLVLYDPHCEGQTRDLSHCEGQTRDLRGPWKDEFFSAARYMENLVSLKKGNQSSSHK